MGGGISRAESQRILEREKGGDFLAALCSVHFQRGAQGPVESKLECKARAKLELARGVDGVGDICERDTRLGGDGGDVGN